MTSRVPPLVVLALLALPLFDFSAEGLGEGRVMGWFLLALIVMGAWGVQAYFMKLANRTMSAESIFFYMMVTGLMLAPVAWLMLCTFPVQWRSGYVSRRMSTGWPTEESRRPSWTSRTRPTTMPWCARA